MRYIKPIAIIVNQISVRAMGNYLRVRRISDMKARTLRSSIKKYGSMVLFLMLVGTLAACKTKNPQKADVPAVSMNDSNNNESNPGEDANKKEDAPSVTEVIKSETERGTDEASQGDTEEDKAAARKAFKAVMNGINEQHTLPDGHPLDWNEFSDMTKNEFAIYDVDQDGKEELLIIYNNASMAGMLEIVYAYDSTTDSVRQQILDFPGFTYYQNGILEAPLSHRTDTPSGDSFWPYSLYQYDSKDDTYHNIAMVDSWDKSVSETSFSGAAFPEERDLDQDGVIYYIVKEGEYEYKDPVDRDEYDKWLAGYIQNSAVLDIPYVNITQENIEGIK